MHLEETTRLINELQNTKDLDRFMNRYDYGSNTISFVDYLEEMIHSHNKKKSSIIRDVDIARSYAYEIFNGFKKPSRDKVIMLSFAIEMTFEETQKLLVLAGYNTLHPKNRRDAIIIHAISKSIGYVDCNILMDTLKENILE